MIVLAQVWLSAKGLGVKSVEDEWDSGRYIVVLGVDKGYVYFQDPYAMMSKAFLLRKAFEAHWRQIMGGVEAVRLPERAPGHMGFGHVQPNAFILLRKDKSGAISGLEGGRVMADSDIAATNAILAAISGNRTGGSTAMRSRIEKK